MAFQIRLGILLLAIQAWTTQPLAYADFQGDVLQDAVIQKAQETPERALQSQLSGIQRAKSLQDLDLSTPFTRQEWAQIQSSVTELFASNPQVKERVAHYFSKLDASEEPPPPNTLIYIGVDLGYGLGLNTNIALVFAHDLVNKVVTFVPAIVARVQAFDLGTHVHLGMGVLAPSYSSPHLTVGVMLAVASAVGAGVGKGIRDAFWVEFSFGSGFQAGPYAEFVFELL